MAERKEAIYREMIEENFPAMPGAAEFVRSLAQRGFVLSVGSSGPELNVSFVLQRLGIRPLLRGVVSGTDVSRAKPAPDIFLKAAERCNCRDSAGDRSSASGYRRQRPPE